MLLGNWEKDTNDALVATCNVSNDDVIYRLYATLAVAIVFQSLLKTGKILIAYKNTEIEEILRRLV